MLRSSSDVFLFNFPSSDVVFNLVFFTFQQLDFDSISSELLKSYSPIQNKNRPYDPSSLLRLFFILNLFNSEYDFYKSKRIDSVLSSDYLSLCGFSDQLPCYTTYFYTKPLLKVKYEFEFDECRSQFYASLLCFSGCNFKTCFLSSFISPYKPYNCSCKTNAPNKQVKQHVL